MSQSSRQDLNPDFYNPSESEILFFKAQTGIKDDEELKQHVLKIQHEAWDVSYNSCLNSRIGLTSAQVVHYGCIRNFGFTKYPPSTQHRFQPLNI